MSMSRETMRRLMQEQRPARKRQLYEVAPSPPKAKRLKNLTGESPSSSPPKDPLVNNGDDESPSFRIKSFYGSKKKLVLSKSPDTEHSNSVPIGTSERSIEKRNIVLGDRKMLNRRAALSPIKNVINNGLKESQKKTALKATKTRTRGKSVPPQTKVNVETKLPREPQNCASREQDESVTPDRPRKFFKNRTPGSESKATGSVVVKKGFNLRFVRQSLNGRNGQSTPGSRTPANRGSVTSAKQGSLTSAKQGSLTSAKRGSLASANRASVTSANRASVTSANRGSVTANRASITANRASVTSENRGSITKTKKSPTRNTTEIKTQSEGSLYIRKRSDQGSASETGPSVQMEPEMFYIIKHKSSESGSDSESSLCNSPKRRALREPVEIRLSREACDDSASFLEDWESVATSSSVSDKTVVKPDTLSSQSFFGFDCRSLASDVSGPVVRSSGSNTTQQSELSSGEERHHGKFYSIFSGNRCSRRQRATESSSSSATTVKGSPMIRKFVTKGDDRQLMLDAGQGKFGATQCKECGMVYSPGDAADETMHFKFHQSALTALKFTGWKRERVIKDFLDDGSRVIIVLPDDSRFMVKKVEDVNRVMGQELGFPDQTFTLHGSYKAFLYISDEKRVEGCCIAESITQGYHILSATKELSDSQRPWFCSSVPVPATVGIGRLWVYGPSRKRGIASRLLDCVRQWFEYGFVIDKSQVAFSDPTPDGRMFAAKYTGTSSFLVYKYNHAVV